MINNHFNASQDWLYANLYEINEKHRLHSYDTDETCAKIKDDYENNVCSVPDIGNRIRKKFEILLYELSKIFSIGSVEESKLILARIIKDTPIYYNSGKNVYDLVNQIEALAINPNVRDLPLKIKNTIVSYQPTNYPNLKNILKSLILYQKVTMHPLSHGATGMTTFTNKEVEESLYLLEKLEAISDSFHSKDVVSV